MRPVIFLGLLILLSNTTLILAQERMVTGQVFDASNETMPGAVIQVKGTTIGTVTDVEGRFGINAKENSTLVISMIGYKTVELNIRNNTSVTVRLEETTIGLEEVVVIGYGTASKRAHHVHFHRAGRSAAECGHLLCG